MSEDAPRVKRGRKPAVKASFYSCCPWIAFRRNGNSTAGIMSDDASSVEEGREPSEETDKSEKSDKVERKMRNRPEEAAAKPVEDSSDEDGVAPAKRGRGRPKGSTKKKNTAKPKAKSGTGRRGRPKRAETKDSGKEDGEEKDANEEKTTERS